VPAPVSNIVDILPGSSQSRGRRLPLFRSRAMKPAAAPLPSRNVSPPAYTQAPAAPPVIPIPVVPTPVGAPVMAPVPVARETSDSPAGHAAPAPAFASVGATDSAQIPAASLFGTRVGDPAPPDEPAGHGGGMFGASVTAPSGHFQGMSASDFEAQKLRDRSAIASEALSELSRLSGYRPQAVENRGEQSLTRRTPQATPGLNQAPETTTPVPHRERNATDVRSMLSGFRAGVERGRADQGRDSDD
jgi:hypothetical protein